MPPLSKDPNWPKIGEIMWHTERFGYQLLGNLNADEEKEYASHSPYNDPALRQYVKIWRRDKEGNKSVMTTVLTVERAIKYIEEKEEFYGAN